MTDRKKEKKSKRILCAFLAALFCAVCLAAAGGRPALADDADPAEVQAADTSSQDETRPEEKPKAEGKADKPKPPKKKSQAKKPASKKKEPSS
jgi:hypothetical protein